MNWVAFLFGTTVGTMLGAGAAISALLLMQKFFAKVDYFDAQDVPEFVGDPALDLAALAVEVLRIMERAYWDNATVLHMADWLHEHGYTPLSDPDEIVPVVRREC